MTHFAEVTVAQWRGDVNRWHAHQNPRLRDAGDTIHKHSLRCCLLLMRLNPDCTKDMLAACVLHDAAETIMGDPPAPAKSDGRLREAYEWAEKAANKKLETPKYDGDYSWIRMVDLLDRHMIVIQHAPTELRRAGWRNSLDVILNTASRLRVLDKVQEIIAEATEKMT
jgi:5'-deoxynucleotidase YfbR-like HD superfamily hydrolase